jgi:hypothetical protein
MRRRGLLRHQVLYPGPRVGNPHRVGRRHRARSPLLRDPGVRHCGAPMPACMPRITKLDTCKIYCLAIPTTCYCRYAVPMTGPTISRLLLGRALRQLRESADVSREQAAVALKCSKARIDHIEVGRNALGYAELVMLLRDRYGADEETLNELETLRARASQRGWWSTAGYPTG